MYAADEVYPDFEIEPFVERCRFVDGMEYDCGTWTPERCGLPAVTDDEDEDPRCAEHAGIPELKPW